MRYSSPPVTETIHQDTTATSSGVNPYAAPPLQNRHEYAASPNPAPPGVQGYQTMGFDGWAGMNDATAQMGVQFGKSAVAAGQDYVEKNVSC